MKYGLIAGGGSFPILTLKAARAAGHQMAVVAVKEEAAPEVEELADSCQWVSLGQLSKLIETFHAEGISQAVMSGRIQHKQIFSAIRPDLRLLKLLNSLRRKEHEFPARRVGAGLGGRRDLAARFDTLPFVEPCGCGA